MDCPTPVSHRSDRGATLGRILSGRGARLYGCLALLGLLVTGSARATVTQIIGSNVDQTVTLGCLRSGKTFNLVNGGVLLTFNTGSGTATSVFDAGPAELFGQGQGYNYTRTSTAGMLLGVTQLLPFTSSGTFTLDAAPNDPDSANSFNGIYDTVRGRMVLWAAKVTAPCNVTNCLHVYTFSGLSKTNDVIVGGVQMNPSPMNAGAVDSNAVYVETFNGANFFLHQLDPTTFADVTSVNLGANQITAFADDGTFLYGIKGGVDNVLVTINKSTFALTNNAVAGGQLFQNGIVFNPNDGFLYVRGANSAGATHLYQVNRSTFTAVQTMSFPATEAPNARGLSMDTLNNRVYSFSTDAPNWVLRRINPATFTNEQTLSVSDGGNVNWMGSLDATHQRFFFADVNTPSHLHFVYLCT